MENLLYDLWLNTLRGIGPYLVRNLLAYFTTSQNVYYAHLSDLIQVDQVGKKTAQTILQNKDLEKVKALMAYCSKENILVVPSSSAHYPHILHLYPKAPTLLYVKGNLAPLASMKSVAIVGARRCSAYGKEATIELTQTLVSQKIGIISGMAKGIDSYAHTAAIKSGGYTVAVLGTGPEKCYPSEHSALMNKVIETGAIISQFPPKCEVHKQNFIQRNELVAMLASQIFVMQATKNSGSLYTAECGLAYHKEVFALPGSIYDPLSEGSNALIAKGASIYLKSSISTSSHSTSCIKNSLLDPLAEEVCNLLSISPLSIDMLTRKLNVELCKLQEILFTLELADHVQQLGGLVQLKK